MEYLYQNIYIFCFHNNHYLNSEVLILLYLNLIGQNLNLNKLYGQNLLEYHVIWVFVV